jgi:hypothetical protein
VSFARIEVRTSIDFQTFSSVNQLAGVGFVGERDDVTEGAHQRVFVLFAEQRELLHRHKDDAFELSFPLTSSDFETRRRGGAEEMRGQ